MFLAPLPQPPPHPLVAGAPFCSFSETPPPGRRCFFLFRLRNPITPPGRRCFCFCLHTTQPSDRRRFCICLHNPFSTLLVPCVCMAPLVFQPTIYSHSPCLMTGWRNRGGMRFNNCQKTKAKETTRDMKATESMRETIVVATVSPLSHHQYHHQHCHHHGVPERKFLSENKFTTYTHLWISEGEKPREVCTVIEIRRNHVKCV